MCLHNTTSLLCLESARLLSLPPAVFECVSVAVTWLLNSNVHDIMHYFHYIHTQTHTLASTQCSRNVLIYYSPFLLLPHFLFLRFTVMASSCLSLSNDLLLIKWLQNKSLLTPPPHPHFPKN